MEGTQFLNISVQTASSSEDTVAIEIPKEDLYILVRALNHAKFGEIRGPILTHHFLNECIKKMSEFGFAGHEAGEFHFGRPEDFKISAEDKDNPEAFVQKAIGVMKDVYGDEYEEHMDEIFYPMYFEDPTQAG